MVEDLEHEKPTKNLSFKTYLTPSTKLTKKDEFHIMNFGFNIFVISKIEDNQNVKNDRKFKLHDQS